MSRNKKKIVRLTETEMVDLIENIVNEVKREKRRNIKENTRRKNSPRRPVSRRR
jgi:hypothetical protein